MYKEHFAAQRPLFSDGVARDTDVYLGPRQQLNAANLKIALSMRDSIAVLTGPAGVGKTTLASYAIRAATTRLALGWLGAPPLTPHELLEQLLAEFEFSPYKSSRVERMQVWRQFLNEMSITDTRVCVLVENAQDYTTDVLRALGSLTGADPNGCPGANVILTSTVPARELLAAQGLETIKQRMRLSARFEPFNAAEMEAYLRHRSTLAGTQYEKIFAHGTAAMLQHYSAGLLRVANNLCETALTVAATRKEPQLRPELLMRVAVGLFGMEPIAGQRVGTETAAVPAATHGEQAERRQPIVGARAVATAAMMAAEASLEAEHEIDAEDDAENKEPSDEQPAGAASPRVATAETASEPSGAVDENDASPSVDETIDELPTDNDEMASPVNETPAVPACETRVPQSKPVASEPAPLAAALPAAVAGRPTAIPVRDHEAPRTTPDDSTRQPAATIEFDSDDPQENPFTVDEQLMAEADTNAGVQDMDLPVLTDSVESDDEVAAAIVATGDDIHGDAALASTLADIDVDVPEDSEDAPAANTEDMLERDVEAEDAARKRDAQAALAHAKALEDISNSMAETLFGDAELEELSATLALATSDDDDLELSLEEDSDPPRSQAV